MSDRLKVWLFVGGGFLAWVIFLAWLSKAF